MPKEKTIARWLPLVGLTFAVFVFNTSEFMPIGLLSDIAADLHIRRALKNYRYFHFTGVVRRHYRAFTRRSGNDV